MPVLTPTAPRYAALDPYSNYAHCGGVIVYPDRVEGQIVTVGNRMFNCHAPNGKNLHAYGIRWELPAAEVARRTIIGPTLDAATAAATDPEVAFRLTRLATAVQALHPYNVTRDNCIQWLCHNDRNGCYDDHDTAAEGWPPMTLDEAIQHIHDQYQDD